MDVEDFPAVTAEDQVSPKWLRSLFRRAFFTADLDDDEDLYIKEGLEFPIWVSLMEEQKMIRFFTFVKCGPEDAPITEAKINFLNHSVLLAKFFVLDGKEDTLRGDYLLTYGDGVIDAHVVKAARRFAGAFLFGSKLESPAVVH